ncbi:MAG: glycosyltransferase [Gammaproteobacteria bacterium]
MLFSAALIVKNEEKFLEPCLVSIRDLVDETVIVDTGSTDRTREIALEYGAKVYEFKWSDDFAAARNFALNLTHGQWILYIDADERVRPGELDVLRERLSDDSYMAYTVHLHPRKGFTSYPELRIFRNDPRIRFQGRMHENIWPGIHLYRSQEGGRIGASEVILDHEGYEGDQHHKHQRNLPLLRKALQEDPERIFSWCHLANVYLALGKERSARKAWNKALGLVKNKKMLQSEDSLPYIGLIQWGLSRRREVWELLNEALDRFPTNLQLHWLHGQALMSEEEYEKAIEVFEHILSCGETGAYDHAISYDTRLFSEIPLSSLAACCFKLGRYRESGHYFELARTYAPDNLEYRVKRELCAMLERSNSPAGQVT